MKRWIGADFIDQYPVISIDLDFVQAGYYGEYYVSASYTEILKKAIQNDTELKVLELIRENAIEKKKLAEKGKWDILLSFDGRYNYLDRLNNINQDPFYVAGTGIQIRRFDSSIIKNTILKARADILQIEMTMEDREIEMASEITRKKATLLTKKEQVISSGRSITSKQQIHDIKLANFLQGTESVDNYLQVFRALVNTREESLRYENRYLDTLRDFNYICGEYFEFLGIEAY
ncbi:MAG: TolC family protein [Candidatus Marinimicrobia bacterium]|nr:TolC family protein [Candidatus Neomarinimicrobiota bacterium]